MFRIFPFQFEGLRTRECYFPKKKFRQLLLANPLFIYERGTGLVRGSVRRGTSYTDREYHPSIPLWSFVCDSLHVQMSIVIHAGLVSLAAQTSLAWAVHQVKHVVNGTKAPRFCGSS